MQRRLRLVRGVHMSAAAPMRRSTPFETALSRAPRRGEPVVYMRFRRHDRVSWWLGFIAGLTLAACLLVIAMLSSCAPRAQACRVYVAADAPINITCD